ncbi:MAG: hypothetical protein HY854_12960 [Burkholderiales bacterium]|nr:hypothetical protein [Burkholderiales bacterium]
MASKSAKSKSPTLTSRNPAKDVVVVGRSAREPAIQIRQVSWSGRYANTPRVSQYSPAYSAATQAFQALPAIATYGEVTTKRLMEVTVNGELVRAKGLNGFRAWVQGEGGRTKEHAILNNPDTLHSLASFAAAWQIASVVVGQKHLADISKRLRSIESSVDSIASFLKTQRTARIQAAFSYSMTVAESMETGAFSASSRQELERIDREMSEVHIHLKSEFAEIAARPAESSDLVGTGNHLRATFEKINRLRVVVPEIAAAALTRVAAARLVAMYPEEPAGMIQARQRAIESETRDLSALAQIAREYLERDLAEQKSRVLHDSILFARRNALRSNSEALVNLIEEAESQVQKALAWSAASVQSQSAISRQYLVELSGSQVTGMRELA